MLSDGWAFLELKMGRRRSRKDREGASQHGPVPNFGPEGASRHTTLMFSVEPRWSIVHIISCFSKIAVLPANFGHPYGDDLHSLTFILSLKHQRLLPHSQHLPSIYSSQWQLPGSQLLHLSPTSPANGFLQGLDDEVQSTRLQLLPVAGLTTMTRQAATRQAPLGTPSGLNILTIAWKRAVPK